MKQKDSSMPCTRGDFKQKNKKRKKPKEEGDEGSSDLEQSKRKAIALMAAALPVKNGKNMTNGMMSLSQTKKSQHGNPKHWMNGKKNTMIDDENGYYQGKGRKGKSKTKRKG